MSAVTIDRKAVIDCVLLIRAVEGKPHRTRAEVEAELDAVLRERLRVIPGGKQ